MGPRKIPKIDRLVLTVAPAPGVSLVGYLVTLARLNVYPTASMLFQGEKYWWYGKTRASIISPLANMTGVDEGVIASLANRPDTESMVDVGRLRISHQQFRASSIWVCSVCWASRKHVARLNELRFAPVCVEHRVETVCRCLCDMKIMPNSLVQNECSKCGECFDLCLPRYPADRAHVRFVYALENMIEEGWDMIDPEHPFFRGFQKGRQFRLRDRIVSPGFSHGGIGRMAKIWDYLIAHDWLADGSPNPRCQTPIEGRIPRHWIYRQ